MGRCLLNSVLSEGSFWNILSKEVFKEVFNVTADAARAVPLQDGEAGRGVVR